MRINELERLNDRHLAAVALPPRDDMPDKLSIILSKYAVCRHETGTSGQYKRKNQAHDAFPRG
jgi:hypothetical protein